MIARGTMHTSTLAAFTVVACCNLIYGMGSRLLPVG